MIRDPFYNDIVVGLTKRLDPELFERCVSDILRKDFPTLVPVRGGGDSGKDGAIGDGQGTAYPLICTTGEDVIGNLTRSLASYVGNGGKRHVAILATSQQLSPKRRQNLEIRAKENGFDLIQIYDQAALSDRLYREPQWCLELLNLVGEPPALSIVPLSRRPLIGNTLIGREKDLQWLTNNTLDRVLVGHPGAGKSCLLQQWAKATNGLFVIDHRIDKIAAAYRAQQPNVLIVDDAHLALDTLTHLRQFRQQSGASFDIVATCWPGVSESVIEALGVPTNRVHNLPLLDRDQIVKVLSSVGLHGSVELVREIVDQADGRPGLAVTLAHLCLNGDVREVAIGDALSRTMRSTFETLIGPRATGILAVLSVAGDSGLSLESTALYLTTPILEVQRCVTYLAAGGVINDEGQGNLSVRPRVLRYLLIKNFFFSTVPLQIRSLLNLVPNALDTCYALIGALSRGANVPDDVLKPMLESVADCSALQFYSSVGPTQSAYVLDNHPECFDAIADVLLYYLPSRTIPLLLTAAIRDSRSIASTYRHPLGFIKAWVQGVTPKHGSDAITRRQQLLQAAKKWLIDGGSPEIALRAFAMAIDPTFEEATTDPGSGNTLRITSGNLAPMQITQFEAIWSDIVTSLNGYTIANWQPMIEAMNAWVYPGHLLPKGPSPILVKAMRRQCEVMLRDLVQFLQNRPGYLQIIKRFGKEIKAKIAVFIDPEFETLYPEREPKSATRVDKQHMLAVGQLSMSWSQSDPKLVASRLAIIEDEAQLANLHWPRYSPTLCSTLAEHTATPIRWARAFLGHQQLGDLIEPFLVKCIDEREKGWQSLIAECLSHSAFAYVTVRVLLRNEDIPPRYLKQAIEHATGAPQMIHALALRKEIPLKNLISLFSAPDGNVASSAAVGHWLSEPKGYVAEDIQAKWRAALFRTSKNEGWIEDILKADSLTAYAWLEDRINDSTDSYYRASAADKEAAGALDTAHRIALLEKLPYNAWTHDILPSLISSDATAYRALLQIDKLSDYHLLPLNNCETDEWPEFAKAALDAGYSEDAIINDTFDWPDEWNQSLSAAYKSFGNRMAKYDCHADARIRQLAANAISRANEAHLDALDKELVDHEPS